MSHSGQEDIPRSPEFLELYREAARGEPPSALDRAILQAARREVEHTGPARWGVRWRGWLGPVSVFATLVLTATVTLLVHEERGREESKAAPKHADSPKPATPGEAPAFMPESKQAAPAGLALPPAAAPPATVAENPSAARDDSATAARSPGGNRVPSAERAKAAPSSAPGEAPAGRGLQERPLQTPHRSVVPEPLQNAPKEESAAVRQPGAGSEALRDIQTTRPTMAEPAAPPPIPLPTVPESVDRLGMPRPQPPPAGFGPESESPSGKSEHPRVTVPEVAHERDAAPRPPEPWLDEIRVLKHQGRQAEAQNALAQFRRTYPGYALPEDLR